MSLSAGLFLRQSQSLVMTPQLMQSIQLLQMTHLELNRFISQEIEKNPLLELAASDAAETIDPSAPEDFSARVDAAAETAPAARGDEDREWYGTQSDVGAAHLNEGDSGFDNLFPDDKQSIKADAPELLGQWKSMPGAEAGDDYDLDDFVAGHVSLRDHLSQQIPFLLQSASDRLVAQHLLDCVDEAGYFCGELAEIAARLGRQPQQVEDILRSLQTLDPPGVMARSLRECLAIQLRQRNRYDPAMEALVNHLDLLARRDFAMLRRHCGVGDEDLLDMLAEIRALNPKPGGKSVV